MKAGDMNRWVWLARDSTPTKQATDFLKAHTIVWEYSEGTQIEGHCAQEVIVFWMFG